MVLICYATQSEGEVLKLKRLHLRQQLETAPALLKLILEDFEFISRKFGIEPTLTRLTDSYKGESGVHADGRAADIRDEYMDKNTYNDTQRDAILHYINARYPRSDNKMTIIHHSFSGGPEHFHIQIPAKQSDIFLRSMVKAIYGEGSEGSL